MWLQPGDTDSTIMLGISCGVPTPAALPATGDGSTSEFYGDNVWVP
jgi:hypothetical protein